MLEIGKRNGEIRGVRSDLLGDPQKGLTPSRVARAMREENDGEGLVCHQPMRNRPL
jgi:hypothetical protein